MLLFKGLFAPQWGYIWTGISAWKQELFSNLKGKFSAKGCSIPELIDLQICLGTRFLFPVFFWVFSLFFSVMIEEFCLLCLCLLHFRSFFSRSISRLLRIFTWNFRPFDWRWRYSWNRRRNLAVIAWICLHFLGNLIRNFHIWPEGTGFLLGRFESSIYQLMICLKFPLFRIF